MLPHPATTYTDSHIHGGIPLCPPQQIISTPSTRTTSAGATCTPSSVVQSEAVDCRVVVELEFCSIAPILPYKPCWRS